MSCSSKQNISLSINQIQQPKSYVGDSEIKGQQDPYLSRIISEACKKKDKEKRKFYVYK